MFFFKGKKGGFFLTICKMFNFSYDLQMFPNVITMYIFFQNNKYILFFYKFS